MTDFEKPIGIDSKEIHARNLEKLEQQNPHQAEIIKRLSAVPRREPDFKITPKMRDDAWGHEMNIMKDIPESDK